MNKKHYEIVEEFNGDLGDICQEIIDLEDGTRSFLVLDKYRTDTTGMNYSCGYHPKNGRGFNAGFCDEGNFVEAVGLMKAYLIEHKLI